jgi:hypothetical protein
LKAPLPCSLIATLQANRFGTCSSRLLRETSIAKSNLRKTSEHFSFATRKSTSDGTCLVKVALQKDSLMVCMALSAEAQQNIS